MNNLDQPIVLVVDDDPRIRDAIVDILEFADVQSMTACNGREGVACYLANAQMIDLVILDLKMPVMGGEEALGELRKIDPEVRVLVSSGFGEAHTVRKLAGQGAIGFLHKPYDLQTLVAAVNEQLGPQTRNRVRV